MQMNTDSEGNLEPLFDRLYALLPRLIATRQPWRLQLHGKGTSVTLEITQMDQLVIRPPAQLPPQVVFSIGDN